MFQLKIEYMLCDCVTGQSGHHYEDGLQECISKLCVHGICTKNEPGLGSTCLCISGSVVKIIDGFVVTLFSLSLKFSK